MYKVKPILVKKDISLFLILSLCVVLMANFYFLFQYKDKINKMKLDYSQLIDNEEINKDFSSYNKSLDFYQEIDQIMLKKEVGISIEKISLTNKIILIYGKSTNMDYINIFKNNISNKYILKKVNKQNSLYSFELERKYE